MHSPEERPVAEWMTPYISLYLSEARPVLLRLSEPSTNALWISSHTGEALRGDDIGPLITQLTKQTVGIGISPHLFRTASATTAAEAKGDMPHLASALLNHKNTRVTEEHYNRASSLRAASLYAKVILQKHFS
jgi:integrase